MKAMFPIEQKPYRAECAARGEEAYASHTARARKCASGAHFIYKSETIITGSRCNVVWTICTKKSEKYKNNLRKMYDSRTLMEKETEQSMILWLTIL